MPPSSKEKLAEDSAAAAEQVLDSAAESEEVLDVGSANLSSFVCAFYFLLGLIAV
jgi:hypothetical protein